MAGNKLDLNISGMWWQNKRKFTCEVGAPLDAVEEAITDMQNVKLFRVGSSNTRIALQTEDAKKQTRFQVRRETGRNFETINGLLRASRPGSTDIEATISATEPPTVPIFLMLLFISIVIVVAIEPHHYEFLSFPVIMLFAYIYLLTQRDKLLHDFLNALGLAHLPQEQRIQALENPVPAHWQLEENDEQHVQKQKQ